MGDPRDRRSRGNRAPRRASRDPRSAAAGHRRLRRLPRASLGVAVAGVVDDGPGLAEDELPRVFERFYLYERGDRERRVGTGLGLAIVRELAEAMGGSVAARSELGVGSTFTVLLPLVPGGAASEASNGASDTRPAFVRIARS